MAEQAKTTKKTTGSVRVTGTAVTGTGSSTATDRTAATATATPRRADQTSEPTTVSVATTATDVPTRPEPSPRNGVRVNVLTLENAFLAATPSRSVAYVQHALRARGFDPGSTSGVVDFATRAAYANLQRSLHERPTGLPTDSSLDHLGFDVVG